MDEEKRDQVDAMETDSASSDSLINDLDDEEEEEEEEKEELQREEPLTEQEIEELIAELLEVESKAAEAQEALEDESLARVEAEVREELAQSLSGDELEKAVAEEMATLKEEWETTLDELETESSHLLEQLDGAGIALPSLYKWIENQAPNGCCTEAWKKRTHWVGSQMTSDANESISDAEKYLQIHRPVRRKHGKVLEEGASGFLQKKLSDGNEAAKENSDVDWNSFSKMCSDSSSLETITFSSKQWAAVYLASTPQQAAELGLKFPGVDEVEEIDDIEGSSSDPFIADAVANEGDLNLSEEQRKKFRKVKEEDDADVDRKLQMRLKRRRRRNRDKEATEKEVSSSTMLKECSSNGFYGNNKVDTDSEDLKTNASEYPSYDGREEPKCNGHSSLVTGSALSDLTELKVPKSPNDLDELDIENKKFATITVDSDDEAGDKSSKSEMVHQANWRCNADNIIPPKHQNENYHCTACGKLANEVHRHPLLKVIVCLDCRISLEAKMQAKDINCLECYCGWCGRSSDLLSCRSCKTLFCAMCIKKNLGEEFFMQVQSSGWQCCCCSPSLLQRLSSELEKVIESKGLVVSSSDSDSDDSDRELDVKISSKRKRKKKIRRILDDAELGEETKRKIAIEKERQERLKSLGAQLSYKSTTMSSANSNMNSYEGDNVEVLGDTSTGYIVNVVREEGEEAVRIPPSISAKLKAHQIAGIRFMWENIIQSIRRVRSGDKGLGCILAHTMGLGKTFQVIAFLYTAMRSVDLGLRTALIVTPVSVLHNWRQEFMKWRPSEFKPLRVFMLDDVPRERRAELLMKWRLKGGVFLIGYTAFRNLSLGKHAKDRHMAREITVALQEGPDVLICDEAHIIKNTRADVTQALKQVKCQRRIALTGSPLQNNLMEYYCMVDFVREGFLGSSHEFRNRFQNPIENGQHTNSTAEDVKIMNQRSHILYEELKGFVQRMDMNVVKKDLPPKTVFVVAVKLSPLQRKLYKRFLDVHGFTSDKISGEKIRKQSFWAGYQALAQIWNHPGILQLMKNNKDSSKREDALEVDDSSSDENTDFNMIPGEKPINNNVIPLRKNDNGFLVEDWWSDLLQENNCTEVDQSGKMVLLLEILIMCCNLGDKALVFSQSLSTLDLIESYLSRLPRPGRKGKFWKKGKDWYRFDGRTESSERQKLVERFNEPLNRRVKCTLISTKAGSLGINLHAANRVIIVDGSWNPTYDLQAIYRVWRYGQTKPVFAYRLLAHGTMEEKIYKRQVTKESLAARVVDRQQVHRTISKEEMLHLFDLGDDENPDTGLGQGNGHAAVHGGIALKDKQSLPHGNTSSDKLMQSVIGRHHPRWIANYHEHETLLQENEDEKLSKEEQDMAWEVYRRTLEWEEVQRVSPDESAFERQQKPVDKPASDRKPVLSRSAPSTQGGNEFSRSLGRARDHVVQRKCTNLSHLLTLRSQGTKMGCSTVCGECAVEISWENLHKDGRSVRL